MDSRRYIQNLIGIMRDDINLIWGRYHQVSTMRNLLVLTAIAYLTTCSCYSTEPADTDIFRGCFWDSATYRFVSDLHFCPATDPGHEICSNVCSRNRPYCQSNSGMTVGACRSICSAQNFRFYALQAGNQCFCGGDSSPYSSGGVVPDPEDCDYPCTGNEAETCGGEYRMDVYEITIPLNGSSCFHPGYIENMEMVSPIDPIIPAYTVFSFTDICPPGFAQEGPRTILCHPVTGWNGSVPACTRQCPDPPLPDFAEIWIDGPKDAFLVGDILQYVCTSDKDDLSGNVHILMCTEDGVWAGDAMDVACTDPSLPLTPLPQTTTTRSSISTVHSAVDATTGRTIIPSSHATSPATGGLEASRLPSIVLTGTASSMLTPNPIITLASDTTTPSQLGNTTEIPTKIPRLTKQPRSGGDDLIKALLPYLLAAGGLCIFVLVMSFVAGFTCGQPKRRRPRRFVTSPNGPVNGAANGAPSNGHPNGHANGHVNGHDNIAYSPSVIEDGLHEAGYKEGAGAFDNPAFREESTSFHGSPRRVSLATSSRGSMTYEDLGLHIELPPPSPPPPPPHMMYGDAPPSPTLPPPPPLPYPGPPTPPPPHPFDEPAEQNLSRISLERRVSYTGSYTMPRPYSTLPRKRETHEFDELPPPPTPPRTASPPLPPPPPELLLQPTRTLRRHSSFDSEPSLTSTPRSDTLNSELYAAINRKPRLRRMKAVKMPIRGGDLNTLDSSYMSVDGSLTSDYEGRGSPRSDLGSVASVPPMNGRAAEMATRL